MKSKELQIVHYIKRKVNEALSLSRCVNPSCCRCCVLAVTSTGGCLTHQTVVTIGLALSDKKRWERSSQSHSFSKQIVTESTNLCWVFVDWDIDWVYLILEFNRFLQSLKRSANFCFSLFWEPKWSAVADLHRLTFLSLLHLLSDSRASKRVDKISLTLTSPLEWHLKSSWISKCKIPPDEKGDSSLFHLLSLTHTLAGFHWL